MPVGAQPAILADEPQSTARAGHFSNARIAALFAVLAAIASIPVLLYPWPPLGDYINHLARMHVIATLRSDPDLARFYQVEWQVIPNLMMDLIVPVLQRVMNVYLAGQTYTITMANMSYGQIPAGLKVGDTIVWVNRDTVLHTATARDHSFALRIAPGKSVKLVVAKAGNIVFSCIFHAAMRGTLSVAP